MGKNFKTIKPTLDLNEREHIAIIGGGGKTSLLLTLAKELFQEDKKIIASTTTKVWHKEAQRISHIIIKGSNSLWREEIKESLNKHKCLFIGERLLENGKVDGINPKIANELYSNEEIDYLIVEADGSANRPIKAPNEHEPVIPDSATIVIGVLGIEALGQNVSPKRIFREDLFCRITGLNSGDIISPESLVDLICHPMGLFKGAQENVKKYVFLNKLDLIANKGKAIDLTEMIHERSRNRIDGIILGSVKNKNYNAVFRK